jgi:phosphoglycerol transferase
MIHIVKTFVSIVLLSCSSLIITVTFYILVQFPNQNVDEIIYTLANGLKGAAPEVFQSAIKQSIVPFIAVFLLLILPLKNFSKRRYIIELHFKKKKVGFNVNPIAWTSQYRISYGIISFLITVLLSYQIIGIDDYIKRLSDYTTIYEDYYIDGRKIAIEFPEQKQNLILLYLESMENTMMDRGSGGGWDYNVIPELTALAKNHLNFSHTDQIGGAFPISRTQWTIAGLVSTTAGIPLHIPIGDNNYTNYENFLAGAYTLGDILQNEGYQLGFIAGSEAEYGGRKNYFTKHGNYEIFDLNRSIQEGRMKIDDKVWWGFDDSDLFAWAKEILIDYARQDEPFSFTILTVNTHFPDGYLEDKAKASFPTQYENVHAHTSKQVHEFVEWFKSQAFFDQTTLVILGDHLSMQSDDFYKGKLADNYERTTYNVFINAKKDPIKTNNRKFTNLDLYPTILASLGVKIEGDRLGLGTNLFSEKQTLVEELGYSYLNRELDKNSLFYNNSILQDDYIKMLEQGK